MWGKEPDYQEEELDWFTEQVNQEKKSGPQEAGPVGTRNVGSAVPVSIWQKVPGDTLQSAGHEKKTPN